LQLDVRIAGEFGESGEVLFDPQRLVGLPAMLLVLQENGEFVGGIRAVVLLQKGKQVGWGVAGRPECLE
jgi:hypothetical protein